jgi:threonine/homoserine/homoserine lactone efflux protein
VLPTEHLLAFALTTFVLVVIPGPSVLFTVGRALSAGRRAALLTVVGNAAGVYLQVVAVALGLGALVESSIAAFSVVKLAGAGYLVYLGVQAIRHRRVQHLAADTDAALASTGKVLREGLVVGVTNPKMIVFLAAVLPQFVDGGVGHVSMQMLVLGAAVPAITLTSDGAWAIAAGTAREWFARSPRRLEVMGGTGGVAMIGIGASLAVSGRKD